VELKGLGCVVKALAYSRCPGLPSQKQPPLCYSLLSATASSLPQPSLCYSLVSATASSLLQPRLCYSLVSATASSESSLLQPPLCYSFLSVAAPSGLSRCRERMFPLTGASCSNQARAARAARLSEGNDPRNNKLIDQFTPADSAGRSKESQSQRSIYLLQCVMNPTIPWLQYICREQRHGRDHAVVIT
jgi:hypothetical protein